jgi:diacylglycerol kinase (ATP)
MSGISFIVNPISGTGKAKRIPLLIEHIFKKQGINFTIRITEYAGHAKTIVAEELQKGVTKIVAVGGDGTVNEIASALLHTKGTLGIIPTGSGNGLARQLNIPMNAHKAIQNIISGKALTIDSGDANGHAFFCTAGIGFDAVVSERFSVLEGRGLLNYIKASLNEYGKFKSEKVRDEQHNIHEGFLLSICNANQYGNNAYICPTAEITDGLLNLVEVKEMPLPYLPIFVYQLFRKKLRQGRYYQTTPFKEITLTRNSPGPVHIDGDPIEKIETLVIRCVPKSLSVIVPAQ